VVRPDLIFTDGFHHLDNLSKTVKQKKNIAAVSMIPAIEGIGCGLFHIGCRFRIANKQPRKTAGNS
jgi:hypothetical protein